VAQTRKAPSHTRFAAVRSKLEAYEPAPGAAAWAYEFALFVFKQGWACLFGGLMLALLLATHLFYPDSAPLHRYDFLTLAALGIQVAMLTFRLETWDEAKVILAFHVVGTVMEIFKTAVGSWAYPEEALLRIAGVPLFSGFMYASVGSYIARVWRIFDFRFEPYPARWKTWLLAVLIYINFFSHHYLPDIRFVLFAGIALLFWRTHIYFTNWRKARWMPLLFGWMLVALFIWFAENIATFANAWVYPSQEEDWHMVSISKLGSWYLLMYISFVLVTLVSQPRSPDSDTSDNE